MKSKVINNCRYVYGMFVEKIMEFVEFMKFEIGRKNEYRSNLVEIYRIKEIYLKSDFVLEFLKQRQKAVGPDRYKIKIENGYTGGDENVIGEVVLMRKNKLIEKAQLLTTANLPDNEKLVYWRF